MTEKQKRFCEYYLRYEDGKRAAIAAGYKERGAQSCAARLLKQEDIRRRLEDAHNGAQQRRIAGNTEILEYLTRVMRGDEEDTALRDRMKAAELLGRSVALFSEGGRDSEREPVVFIREGELC